MIALALLFGGATASAPPADMAKGLGTTNAKSITAVTDSAGQA